MESALHLLILSISLSSVYNASAYNPTTAYFLNCGSSTNITFSDESRTFTTDSPFLISSSTSNTVSVTDPINQSNSLYNTARLFTHTSSYNFPIKTTGTYVLRLHFFPFITKSYNLINSSNFNVSSPQTQTFLLGSFSPSKSNTSTIKEYYLWLDTDGLILTFTPNSPSLAFISAIELFTAPLSLINDTEPTTVSTTGQDFNIGDLSRQSLETLYRVNVGGPLITPTNDTLWRTWIPDDPFLYSISSSSKEDSTSTDNIKYGLDTREVAPPFVYSTVREMNISSITRVANSNFNFNLTWTFKVPAGYKYFIRMHFCDIVSNQPLDLIFDVYIGDASAYPNLQLGSLTHLSLDAAHYLDFITDEDIVENSGLLNVSVGRSSKSTPDTANAIMNGLEIMKINNSVGSLNGSYNSFASNSVKRSTHVGITVIIVSVVAAALVSLIAVSITIVILMRKRTKPAPLNPKANTTTAVFCSPHHKDSVNKSSSGATPRMKMGLELYIPLSDIKLATNDFDEALVIGHGGFGKVYKGVLSDGTMVAVKRAIGRSRQGYPEFVNEINLLSKIRHRHLVSIIGYCDEMGEMILVYEFMENGTLKNYLYGSLDLPCLSWKQRLQVCIGAARGLDYLHTAHSPVIIHRDVKSTNILLGQDFLAKISDFGISKLGPLLGEDTYVSTGVKGSFGYFDPEYFRMLRLTTKSDVYSFGVVLFEVLCARPVIDPRFKDEAVNLADWALHYLKKGKLEKIIDVRLVGEINPKSLEKFGEIAERCLAKHGDDRPTIRDVLWDLEYAQHLQETELIREPHEDSGIVDSQIQSLSLMRRVSFACIDIDDEDNNVIEMSSEQLDVNP
ncbi:probable receptor-like protein kinase At5g59700 [Dioscorea cayenensis subsp. rotundata]|uniref:Probable receptor-like protein kinase At5g59700 n=1 Tax=Dioscorea cayennensis subsp. rotundata TaxID=55577 RepID=A0AB40AK38_DIOCR|nr:probable receptor-like protein kinase At5g59700 [Dioscorea cayenensis subsp. rotundata]